MDYKLRAVSLDRIQTDDQTFRITTTVDKPDLAASIAAVGLLQPPVLLPVDGAYTIICGFRRIEACRQNRQPTLTVRLLPEPCPPLDCAGIAIIDNAAQRPLNIVEQSRAVTLINQFAQCSSDASRLSDLAGLPAGKRAVDRIKPLAAMSSDLQHAILEGSVALPVALLIDQLPGDDASSLCDFFRLINTGLNVQRELLGLISDISGRDDTPISRLIEAPDVTAILNDADLPMPQRVNRLRRLLKTSRFPELSAAEVRFRKQLKALKLSPQIQFLPPPFFEGTSFRLAMTIDSKRQLRSVKHEIDKLADHLDLLPD